MLHAYLYQKSAQAATAVVLLGTLLAVVFFGILEERSVLVDGESKKEDARLENKVAEQKLGELERGLSRYRKNLSEIAYFQEHFLRRKKERLREVSTFIRRTASKHHLEMDRVRYKFTHRPNQEMEIYEIELPLKGRYRDLRAFIAEVEQADQFLVLTKLELSGETDRQGAVQVDLAMETFFEGGPS